MRASTAYGHTLVSCQLTILLYYKKKHSRTLVAKVKQKGKPKKGKAIEL